DLAVDLHLVHVWIWGGTLTGHEAQNTDPGAARFCAGPATTAVLSSATVWVGDGYDGEMLDTGEITRIAGIDGQVPSDHAGGYEGIEGSRLHATTRPPQTSSNPTEHTGCRSVERERIEGSFGFLQPSLASLACDSVVSDEGPNREFSEADGSDHRLCGQVLGMEAVEQHHRIRVEDTDGRRRHSRWSTRASTSSRSRCGSSSGRRRTAQRPQPRSTEPAPAARAGPPACRLW